MAENRALTMVSSLSDAKAGHSSLLSICGGRSPWPATWGRGHSHG